MDRTKELLEAEIETELERLEDMEPGSDEYKLTIDGVTKLIDRKIEMDKNEEEFNEKRLSRLSENESKEKRSKLDKISTIGAIAVPVFIFVGETIRIIWGTNKTLKFEETGTVTTNAGRSFINKLFSKK